MIDFIQSTHTSSPSSYLHVFLHRTFGFADHLLLPDIFMLGFKTLGFKTNFHIDVGFFYCILTLVFIGLMFRIKFKIIGIALLALLSHLPLDYYYTSNDSSNFYAHPLKDFIIEVVFIFLATLFYLNRQKFSGLKRLWFAGAVGSIVVIQAIWNFTLN